MFPVTKTKSCLRQALNILNNTKKAVGKCRQPVLSRGERCYMKPKIGVVFPKITDKDIADLEIEKIRVSKTEEK